MIEPLDSRSPLPQSTGSEDFEALLIRYQPRIYFFIRSMVFNPEDARDLLQEVNIIIVRKRARFIPGTDFKSWAFAIARFECLSYLAALRKSQARILDDDSLELLSRQAEQRADEVESWMRALEKCRRDLLPNAKDLLERRYHLREPLESIADRQGTSVGSLKQKLFRIRHFLRTCILKRLGLDPSESAEKFP